MSDQLQDLQGFLTAPRRCQALRLVQEDVHLLLSVAEARSGRRVDVLPFGGQPPDHLNHLVKALHKGRYVLVVFEIAL